MDAEQLHRLARVLREVALGATADPGEAPVSAGEVAITEDIARHEQASVGEIAERTGLAQSLVSKTVAKLVDAGVAVTGQDPADGRRVLVSISPGSGVGLLRSRARRPIEPALRARYPDVSDAMINQACTLLDQLATILTMTPTATRGGSR